MTRTTETCRLWHGNGVSGSEVMLRVSLLIVHKE